MILLFLQPVLAHERGAHPLHVSTANITLNGKDGKFEIICSLFSDDFEQALKTQYNQKVDLIRPDMHAQMEALVKSYLAANLQIKTGSKGVPLHCLGYQINKEAAEVFLESDQVSNVKIVEVHNRLLYNIFSGEINIVHIVVGGVRKSGKLDFPSTIISQSF